MDKQRFTLVTSDEKEFKTTRQKVVINLSRIQRMVKI